MISRPCGLKTSEVTCELVACEARRAEVVVCQKWMTLSFDPPPDASNELCQGHQASALTAAGASETFSDPPSFRFLVSALGFYGCSRINHPPLSTLFTITTVDLVLSVAGTLDRFDSE